ncbi:hypothetical protein [Lysinibacillus sp. ZYM-1]|uniref:hypothetical protein n=1 Tax=Lysinibacillus sp. ZYM-1 TaxID=1681184 RepID=UPI0006CE776D|nr:hypothetical protein [Lysinibacillus sp. ZYM-1]KPN97751.1 hypothetical protein AO843_11320 [Lysinibacillus sp. ZYM-1]
MQQHHTLEKVVQESSNSVYGLSAQMIQLEVIQGAVARLLERIDDIVHKGWDKDRGMAYLAIDEIRDTVRLIDMGFHPLFKEMSEEVKTLNINADELYETVIKGGLKGSIKAATNEENKKADAPTSTNETYSK